MNHILTMPKTASKRDEKSRYKNAVEYFRNAQRMLDGLHELHLNDERIPLLAKLTEEAERKVMTLGGDQQASKIVESLCMALASQIMAWKETPNYGGDASKNGNSHGGNVSSTADDEHNPSAEVLGLFCRLARAIAAEAYNLASDFYGSHLLQTALAVIPPVYSVTPEIRPEIQSEIEEIALLFATNLVDEQNLVDQVCNQCGSHVFRSLITSLAGFSNDPDLSSAGRRHSKARRSHRDEQLPDNKHAVPKSFLDAIENIAKCITSSTTTENVPLLVSDTHASAFMQVLLKTTVAHEMTGIVRRLIKMILGWDKKSKKDGTTKKSLFVEASTSPSGSRLMEAVIKAMPKSDYDKLILSSIPGNAANLACHRIGNFVVSNLLLSPHLDEPTLGIIIGELEGAKGILEAQTAAVLWRVADACRRLQCHHDKLVKILLTLLECDQTDMYPCIFPSILAMAFRGQKTTEYAEGDPAPSSFNPTGCSILSALAFFPRKSISPILAAVKAFMSMPNTWMVALAKDKQGSRAVEALVAPGSTILDQKAIDRFSRKFEGNYATMALHPHAAFAVSALYRAVQSQRKSAIIKELLKIQDTLKEANYSLYRRCEIPLYKNNESEWNETQSKKLKARSMFESIFENGVTDEKPAKRKKPPD